MSKTFELILDRNISISTGIPTASPFCKGGLRGISLMQPEFTELPESHEKITRSIFWRKRLKKQVTIRMGIDIIEYFKKMSEESGIPYQNLINLYLRNCVQSHRKISIKWPS
jgi:uncharacterized protein (DUF4415 family)